MNLPSPRSVVQAITTTPELLQLYNPNSPLSDAAYDAITKALLQWWSLGIVTIEVFDGERFNQEIFMGFFDLLLNGFMVLIKKPEDLEIKGSFQLCKQKPTDRISGNIKLHAFMHIPEKSYIIELLQGTTTTTTTGGASAISSSINHHGMIEKNAVFRDSDQEEPDEDKKSTSISSSARRQPPPPAPVAVSSSRSSPEEVKASHPPAPVYSSQFMQSLIRHTKQMFTSPTSTDTAIATTATPTTAYTGYPATETGSARKQNITEKSPVGGSSRSPVQSLERELGDRQLEESNNIRFNPNKGEPISQKNISESARLLKDKLRRSKTARRPATAPSANIPQEAQQDISLPRQHQNPEDTEGSPQQQQHRSPSNRPMTSAGTRSVAASRALKEQSVDSSNVRRRSMVDITERLAGLSAVQYSTEAVLDNLNCKLEAKLRVRSDVAPSPVEEELLPVTAFPVVLETAARPPVSSSRCIPQSPAELLEPEEDNEGSDSVYQDSRSPPLSMEDRERRALHRSYNSQEDDDAPEMGADSAVEDDERLPDRDNTDYDGDSYDLSEDFQDIFDEEEFDLDFSEGPAQQQSNHHLHDDDGGYVSTEDAIAVIPEKKEEEGEYWEYQSDPESSSSEREGEEEFDAPVHTVQRLQVDLSAPTTDRRPVAPPRPPPPPPQPQPPRTPPLSQWEGVQTKKPVQTIYHEDEDGGSFDEFAEGGFSTRTEQNSTMSSVYSTSIMEFLSPEPSTHGQDRMVSRNVSGVADDDSGDELIVIARSSSTSQSFGHSSAGSSGKMFEVQSAHTMRSPGGRHSVESPTCTSPGGNRGSPSRSLFTHSPERAPISTLTEGVYRSPVRSNHESNERRNTATDSTDVTSPGSTSMSPAVHRVVLELDDLEL